MHFAAEIARRVAAAIGGDRVGIRLSPAGGNGEMKTDADTDAVYLQLMKELPRGGARLRARGRPLRDGWAPAEGRADQRHARGLRWHVHRRGRLRRGAGPRSALQEKRGELVAFGRPFIANPTLVKKLKTGAALRAPDFKLAYTPGPEGYIDYPLD